MRVTDVLRGEDHVSNTALQIQMFTALGAPPPRFAHEALLVGKEGKLSKRLGSLSVAALRDGGIEPEAVVALLARLGTSEPVEPILERQVLVDSFALAHFGRAPARFDEDELARLNAGIMHHLPYERVAAQLPAGMGAQAWEAIRPNLTTVADAADWWTVVTGPIDQPDFDDETRAYLAGAATALVWGDDPWGALTSALKDATGRKGKALFHPLRQALTGRDSGPDMHTLLPLIGEVEARRRLGAASR
jgi:glutamyl-tRNA synthetase